MQKIWICGASGQIGKAINRVINKLEYEIMDTGHEDVDVTDLEAVLRFGEVNRPDVIINCAGMTSVRACEENPVEAFKINALGARNLGIIASKLQAKIVQISTDDVFDGKSTKPYNEFDTPNPVTMYGKSKLAGELYVKEFTSRHFIIRSNWVYGDGANNFVSSFLARVEVGETLAIASDHVASPTSANELARFLIHLIHTSEYGTYHATNKGTCSRYEFAQEILRLTKKSADMKAVSTAESDYSADRPEFAVLYNLILSAVDIYEFPDWKVSLKEYLQERGVTNVRDV